MPASELINFKFSTVKDPQGIEPNDLATNIGEEKLRKPWYQRLGMGEWGLIILIVLTLAMIVLRWEYISNELITTLNGYFTKK